MATPHLTVVRAIDTSLNFTPTTDEEKGVVCYSPTMISSSGMWQGVSPLEFSLPIFIVQISIIVVVTRILVILLKPFRQPRVIAEIIAGVILGPSVMGRTKQWADGVFPRRSLLTLETVAHLGLLYFLFLVGVQMDIAIIRQCGRRAIVIAGAGMALPFLIGTGTSFIFQDQISINVHQFPCLLFMGLSLSVTAFPVLARILAEIKLANSDLGRMAMSSGVVNDICAWVLLALTLTVCETHQSVLASLWVLLSGMAFVSFSFFVIRPLMRKANRRVPDGESITDFQVCVILTGVMTAGAITDTIGLHSVFGAFVYGLAIPNNGPLAVALVEKLEDFVTGLLLPLFFATSGLRTNTTTVTSPTAVALLVLVFVLASIGKIVGTTIMAAFYNMPFREGLSLGFLMNTRGVVDIIVLNIGRDKEVLDDQSFAIMVLASVAMTALVIPVVTSVHRQSRRLVGYKRRNLEISKPDAEIRLLACVHGPRNVPSMISLIELANPTKRSPIFVYAVHLIELTNRASSMLVVHNTTTPNATRHGRHMSISSSPNLFSAFENYEQRAGGVSIQPLTTISPYSTMHEDVCLLAEDKHAALIVLPFHKQQTVDGGLETINPAIRQLNEKILSSAPCSVAVLVNRGLSATGTRPGTGHNAALLFFGGPDDREAVAFAARMVENPTVSLKIIRFLRPEDQQAGSSPNEPNSPGTITTVAGESYPGRNLDENCLKEFRARNQGNNFVGYTEKLVNNAEEVVSAIRYMESMHQLYIVGRGYKNAPGSPLTAGLQEWSEYPELGPIGDVLVMSDFTKTVSVLVVQQYVTERASAGAAATAASSQERQPSQQKQGYTTASNADPSTSVRTETHVGVSAAFGISR
ncbi:Cation/H(+) antiporter 15 [Rhynchospora pubera]|uniref:Cation/H(+) antiporter 15 n=1 Tax=Rhynchospora pubera TaxID=906938 RepID=A0AAV8FYL8_9POAL|nr:Cation/H(+) antiporter 15 [Rhynchospora pubera]